jgi:hypothetical protein
VSVVSPKAITEKKKYNKADSSVSRYRMIVESFMVYANINTYEKSTWIVVFGGGWVEILCSICNKSIDKRVIDVSGVRGEWVCNNSNSIKKATLYF